jgi:CHASE3 domain sensor protein
VSRVPLVPDRRAASSTTLISLLALASIPLILLLLGKLLDGEFQQSRSLRKAVDESYVARVEVQRLLSIHQDIETGQRGFVLTGDASFLEPFERGRAQLEPALRTVERRLAPDPALRVQLAELQSLSRDKLRFAEQVVARRQAGREEDAARLVAAGRGKAVMDEIRARIARIAAAEEARIASSTREADAARARTQRLTFLLLAGSPCCCSPHPGPITGACRPSAPRFAGWRT